jgi:hypothetical protein
MDTLLYKHISALKDKEDQKNTIFQTNFKGPQRKEDWLRDQCNRLKNGTCNLTSCMTRGGFKYVFGAKVDYNLATCCAFEIHEELSSLRGRLDYLNKNTVRHDEGF